MTLKVTKLMSRKGLAEINNKLAVGPIDEMIYIAQRAPLEEQPLQKAILEEEEQNDEEVGWKELVMRHSAIRS